MEQSSYFSCKGKRVKCWPPCWMQDFKVLLITLTISSHQSPLKHSISFRAEVVARTSQQTCRSYHTRSWGMNSETCLHVDLISPWLFLSRSSIRVRLNQMTLSGKNKLCAGGPLPGEHNGCCSKQDVTSLPRTLAKEEAGEGISLRRLW